MIKISKSGGKITLILREKDPLTKKILAAVSRILKKEGRTVEAAKVDDPPEIDPGG